MSPQRGYASLAFLTSNPVWLKWQESTGISKSSKIRVDPRMRVSDAHQKGKAHMQLKVSLNCEYTHGPLPNEAASDFVRMGLLSSAANCRRAGEEQRERDTICFQELFFCFIFSVQRLMKELKYFPSSWTAGCSWARALHPSDSLLQTTSTQ